MSPVPDETKKSASREAARVPNKEYLYVALFRETESTGQLQQQ